MCRYECGCDAAATHGDIALQVSLESCLGRRPRLELPPSDAPRFNLTEIASRIDGSYTDIAAALKLALASFPEGTSKRIVLISDGHENLGSAEAELARLTSITPPRVRMPVAD